MKVLELEPATIRSHGIGTALMRAVPGGKDDNHRHLHSEDDKEDTSARRRRPARPRPSRRSGRAHHISRGIRWVGQATERAPPSSRGEHFQEEITPARRARARRKTEPCILGSCSSKVTTLQRAAGPRGRPRARHPMLRPDHASYERQLQTASQEVATATQGHGRDLTVRAIDNTWVISCSLGPLGMPW